MSCILGREFNFKSTVEGEVYTFVVVWQEVEDKVYVKSIETPRGHAGFAIPIPEQVVKDMYIATQMVRADTFADHYTGVPQITGHGGSGFICMS